VPFAAGGAYEHVAGASIVPGIDCPPTRRGIFVLSENNALAVPMLAVAPFSVWRSAPSQHRHLLYHLIAGSTFGNQRIAVE
jgi:hypothetical protein